MASLSPQLAAALQQRSNEFFRRVAGLKESGKSTLGSLIVVPESTGFARTVRCASKASKTREEFFRADIVEYGNRYNRPDRFPRLKRLATSDKPVPVRKWLRDQRATLSSAFAIQTEPPVSLDEGDFPAGCLEEAKRFSLLLAQGRLEDAADVTKAALAANNPWFAVNPELVLYGPQEGAVRCVQVVHSAVRRSRLPPWSDFSSCS